MRDDNLKSYWQLAHPMPTPKPEPNEMGHERPGGEKIFLSMSSNATGRKKKSVHQNKEHLRLKKRTDRTMPTPRPVTANMKKKGKGDVINVHIQLI